MSPLNPIIFNDFRPGIADRPGVNYPPEQATRDLTYRCRCDRSGALIPGPGHDFDLSGTDFNSGLPDHGYFCAGIFASGPITPASGTASSSERFHELWMAVEYDDGGDKHRRLIRRRQFENAPTDDTIDSFDGAAGGLDINSAWGCTFGQSRGNHAASTSPGIPVLAIGWGSNVTGAAFVCEFPDDDTPTSNTPATISTDSALVITHQNRFVLRFPTAYGRGTNGEWSTTEDLKWAPANNPQGALSVLQSFYPEAANGYGLIASMSANELFCLKEDGAIVLSGDLNNPTVTNLPMVIGTGGIPMSGGIRSVLGFLYPTRGGLYSWTHGDSSQPVSPQMLNDFTRLDSESFLGQSYSWANIGELVFLSNNFMFDTITKSFWRLEDPDVMQFRWMTAFRQYIYGAATSYTVDDPELVRGYDVEDKASSYSWQSHPLWESIDRVLTIREIELVAQGKGIVRLSVMSTANQPKSVSIHLDDTGFPERHRLNFATQGRYVQLRVEADSGDTTEAPTVFSVSLHPSERARLSVS